MCVLDIVHAQNDISNTFFYKTPKKNAILLSQKTFLFPSMTKNIFNFIQYIFCISLIIFLTSCGAPRPNINIPTTSPPGLKLSKQPRVAVVLGGGGARGMAHVGVLKVLQQENIPIDLIVGTSAGNIVGALYADNPNAARIQTILMQTGLSDILDISPSLQGPVSGNALQNFLLNHLRARTYNQLRIPFISVATDLKTGEMVTIDSGPIAPGVNASAALPPVFRPVKLYGRTLVDGGFTDLVPVDVARRYKPDIIIAVNIIPDLPRGPMSTNIISVYDRAYLLGDARFTTYNMEGADIKLHPYVGQAGLFDSSDKLPLIRAGEAAMRRALPQLCALLKDKNIPSNCS